MRRGVNEVGERYQGRGEADYGAVEGGDQDLWVGVERIGDEEVASNEGLETFALDVPSSWEGARNGNIGTATVIHVCQLAGNELVERPKRNLRREVASFPGKDCDVDLVVFGDFVQ